MASLHIEKAHGTRSKRKETIMRLKGQTEQEEYEYDEEEYDEEEYDDDEYDDDEYDDDEYDDDERTNVIKIWLIVATIAILLLLTMGSCAIWKHSRASADRIVPQGEDWNGQQNPKEFDGALIEIPIYEHLYVSESNPYIWLNNPASNEDIAYFRYSVKEDGKVIFGEAENEQVWIEAGKAVQVDMAERISFGDHDITICIEACDPDTNEALNGAEVKAKITMQGGPTNVESDE